MGDGSSDVTTGAAATQLHQARARPGDCSPTPLSTCTHVGSPWHAGATSPISFLPLFKVPTLNKMKQQLHQLSVSFAQLTNEALMAWDPELEYKLHLLQEQLLIIKRNEDALDRYDQDEVNHWYRGVRGSREPPCMYAGMLRTSLGSPTAPSLAPLGRRRRHYRERIRSWATGPCSSRSLMRRHVPRAESMPTSHSTLPPLSKAQELRETSVGVTLCAVC